MFEAKGKKERRCCGSWSFSAAAARALSFARSSGARKRQKEKKDFSKNVFFFLKNPLIFFSLTLKFPNDFRPLSFSLVYFAPSRVRDGNL